MNLDLISLTQKLIQIPSESSSPLHQYSKGKPAEFEIMSYLYELARSLNIKAELIEVLDKRPNLYLYFPNPGKSKILFDNHLDTVSAQNMIIPPFEGMIKKEKLWGRGACDVKGSAGTLLNVLFDAHINKKKLNYDVTIVFTVDEECSFSGATHACSYLKNSNFEFGIALEPTKFEFIFAHKGVYCFRVIAIGKAAHSAKPELGDNAIYKLIPALEKLRKIEKDLLLLENKVLGKSTFSINVIQGGKAFNIIPDECSIECDLRYVNEESLNLVKNIIQEIAKDTKNYRVEEVLNSDVFTNNKVTSIEENFLQSNRLIGLSPKRVSTYFGTDCSKIKSLAPLIIWGPGTIQLAHTQNEHIELKELENAQTILKNFLLSD